LALTCLLGPSDEHIKSLQLLDTGKVVNLHKFKMAAVQSLSLQITYFLLLLDCARLTLERFLSVGRAPTSATEPSVQLDLKSGTACRRNSNSRTCHTAISDSRRRHFVWLIRRWTKATCESAFSCDLEILLLTYLLISKRERWIIN